MSPDGPIETLDVAELDEFLAELTSANFIADDTTRRAWTGPLPESLRAITDTETMRIVLRDGWPYLPPLVEVDGIDSWHADHDRLCLWQQGDDTRAWMTLQGLHTRIDEWVADANNEFRSLGAALDPHLYFSPLGSDTVGLDIEGLVSGAYQDGQHGFLHLRQRGTLLEVVAGQARPTPSGEEPVEGRWFYRAALDAPPARLADFEAALTETQRQRYETHLRRRGVGIYVLIFTTPHGHAPLVLFVDNRAAKREARACWTTPTALADRLRRAGPDAVALRGKRIVILGVGAIGSHVADLLSRSGIGHLALVDSDVLHPVGQVRHAAEADAINTGKAAAMKRTLRHLDWTTIEVDHRNLWAPADLAARIAGADLVIEATGITPFSELVSRIAARDTIPVISVALYRGGGIVRVRRQAEGDVPFVLRPGHWRYPRIPAGDASSEYVGVEAGCAAPIHNAPPTAVTHAGLAAEAAIDLLTGRRNHDDEHIEVLTPREPPFDHRGRLLVARPSVHITDSAAAAMRTAAGAARPDETGEVARRHLRRRRFTRRKCGYRAPPEDPSPQRVQGSGRSHACRG